MGVFQDGAAAAQATSDLQAYVLALRARLRWNAAWTAAAHALLRWTLPCLLAGFAAHLLAPAWTAVCAAVWLAAGGAAGLLAARRVSAVGDAAVMRLVAEEGIDAALAARLGDELATACERPGGREAMRPWLEQTVRAGVAQVPRSACARVGRRRFGREVLAVPLAALLLWFAWLQLDLPAGAWPGLQRAPQVRSALASPVPASPLTPTPPPPPPASAPAEPPSGEPERSAPAPSPQADAQPPTPEPAPLLELPTVRRFVVPRFVDDGPTRRARVHAADVEQGGAGGAADGGAGAGAPAAAARPTREEFARAAEQALASRHVPPAEQPIVRRFFTALQKAAP